MVRTQILCTVLLFSFAGAVGADDIPRELRAEYRQVFRRMDLDARIAFIDKLAERDDEAGALLLVEILARNDEGQERGFFRKREAFCKEIDGIFGRAISDKRMLSKAEDANLQSVKGELAGVDERIAAVVEVRWRAMEALSSFTGVGPRKALQDVAVVHKDWFVRYATVKAIASHDEPDPVEALRIVARDDSSPQVATAALDGLALRKAGVPVEELLPRLDEPDWPLRAAAARCLGALGDLGAVRPLIDRLGKENGRLRTDIDEALHTLTGFTMGGDHPRWEGWWKVHGKEIGEGTYVPPGSSQKEEKKASGVVFYGIRTLSRSIIFVLDVSMSMKQKAKGQFPVTGGDRAIQPEGNRKIDIARSQLKNAILALPEGAHFNVVFYRQGVTMLSPRMVVVNRRNVEKAFEFIDGNRPAGGTNIFDALHRAFDPVESVDSGARITSRNYEGLADTVFLLSDGEPNYGRFKTNDGMIREIERLNGYRKIVLHAIGIGEHNRTFMKRLAGASGGQYASQGQ